MALPQFSFFPLVPADDLPILGEIVPSRKHRNRRTCLRCGSMKRQCTRTDSRCNLCASAKIPAIMCSMDRVVDHRPFEKWKDETYKVLFTGVITKNHRRRATLRFYPQGPLLEVLCCEFVPTQYHQIHALRKNPTGWYPITTTAFCLATNVDISSFIKESVKFALDEACTSDHIVANLFRLIAFYQNHKIIRECLEIYTALRLITIGCQFAGAETLGMTAVDQPGSPWDQLLPVPRMVKNQLNHLLELQIMDLDAKVTDSLHRLGNNRQQWIIAALTVFLLLHIREIDAGRIIYWNRYKDNNGFWIHPSRPSSLIEEEVTSCNSLLQHFHIVLGSAPLAINWDKDSNQRLLGNNEIYIGSMKALQTLVKALKKDGLIGWKASERYQDGDPSSVGFTISSLIFSSIADAEVKEFY